MSRPTRRLAVPVIVGLAATGLAVWGFVAKANLSEGSPNARFASTLPGLAGAAVALFCLPLVASRLSGRPRRFVSQATRRRVEWAAIGLALLGLAIMIQPFAHPLFRVGFFTLLIAGIVYISTTFWPPDGVTAWRAALLLYWVVYALLIVLGVSVALAPALL